MAKPRNIAADIIRLRSEGKTYAQIKAVLNCAKSTISYHVGADQTENIRAKSNGYKNRIKNFIQQYKAKTPCHDCGGVFNYYVMQFDHLPQFTKSFSVSKFHQHTNSLEKVIKEIHKCDLVCANCHTERGYQRRLHKTRTKKQVKNLLEFGLD